MESIETKALARIKDCSQKLMFQAETVAYACISSHYPIEITRDVPTASTNGRVRKYNPDFIMSLKTDAEVMGVISHEAEHDGKKHMFRLGNRDLQLANIAADYQVNQDLLRIPFLKLPQGALFDSRFDGMSFEAIYRVLEAEQQQEQDQQKQNNQDNESSNDDSDDDKDSSDDSDAQDNDSTDDESSDDSSDSDEDSDNGDENDDSDDSSDSNESSHSNGTSDKNDETSRDDDCNGGKGNNTIPDDTLNNDSDDNGTGNESQSRSEEPQNNDKPQFVDRGGCGGFERPDIAGNAAEMAELENQADEMIAQVLNSVSRFASGVLPGNLQGMAIEKRRSTQNWEQELQEFFTTSTKTDFSWSRPDRRFGLSDFILPSEILDGINHFGVGVDFSLSIQMEWLSQFVSNLQAILDTGKVDKLTVVLFHTSVFQSFEFNSGDIVEIDTAERGGTMFAPVFEWFKENAPDIAGLCMLTDLEPFESWNQISFGDRPALNDVKPDCPVLFAVYGNPIISREYIKRHGEDADFGRCLPLWDN